MLCVKFLCICGVLVFPLYVFPLPVLHFKTSNMAVLHSELNWLVEAYQRGSSHLISSIWFAGCSIKLMLVLKMNFWVPACWLCSGAVCCHCGHWSLFALWGAATCCTFVIEFCSVLARPMGKLMGVSRLFFGSPEQDLPFVCRFN